MLKYKIKDLLLTYENRDCRLCVLNKDKTKIKIITKNQILPITDSLEIYVDTINHIEFFAYEAAESILVYPIVIKGLQANEVLLKNDEPKKFDSFEELNQLSSVLLANEMYRSSPILSAIFGIDDDFEFKNENRNKFIDITTIEKIEKAINTAESRNEFYLKQSERLEKQRQQNQEDEKSYNSTLEF